MERWGVSLGCYHLYPDWHIQRWNAEMLSEYLDDDDNIDLIVLYAKDLYDTICHIVMNFELHWNY